VRSSSRPAGGGFVDGGEGMWSWGDRRSNREREENLRYLFEVLVAEDSLKIQGAGLWFPAVSDRGPECPGAGGLWA